MASNNITHHDIDRLRVVIARLARWMRQVQADSGLTPTQNSVLATIAIHGPIGMGELAQREGLNPTMLSRVVANLGAAGLVVRTTDPADRRAASVQATAAGKRLRSRMQRERSAALGAHLDTLDEEQQASLLAALPILEALAEDLKGRRA